MADEGIGVKIYQSTPRHSGKQGYQSYFLRHVREPITLHSHEDTFTDTTLSSVEAIILTKVQLMTPHIPGPRSFKERIMRVIK